MLCAQRSFFAYWVQFYDGKTSHLLYMYHQKSTSDKFWRKSIVNNWFVVYSYLKKNEGFIILLVKHLSALLLNFLIIILYYIFICFCANVLLVTICLVSLNFSHFKLLHRSDLWTIWKKIWLNPKCTWITCIIGGFFYSSLVIFFGWRGVFFSPNNQSIYTNVNNVIDIDSDGPLVLIFIISAIWNVSPILCIILLEVN